MKLRLEFVSCQWLTDFPSGSSINFYKDKLYLVGDDANHLLILDENFRKVKDVFLFDYPGHRIPKAEKADFETSVVIRHDSQDQLLLLGSASRENRTKAILIPLQQSNSEPLEAFGYKEFTHRLNAEGIEEINIEAATKIGSRMLLGNRGHLGKPANHLVLTDCDFWKNPRDVAVAVLKLVLPFETSDFIGLSEMFYVESNDLLLLTLSSERTGNAYDDGVIGDSYLAWIEKVSTKIDSLTLQADEMLNLSGLSDEFKGEKVEGLCVSGMTNHEFVVHLVADNDLGQSKLFKVKGSVG